MKSVPLSLQAVSVGKHVKGYHYIIANLVRRFCGCSVLFLEAFVGKLF